LFVKLDETGADGLIPIRSLGREFFQYDDDSKTLTGSDSGVVIGLGQRVVVRLAEAIPMTGGLMLELLEIDGAARTVARSTKRSGRYQPKRPAQAAAKDAKQRRKIVRKPRA
jgi:ribonuclease R